MLKKILVATTLATSLLVTPSFAAPSDYTAKVAVVNIPYIFLTMPQSKAVQEAVEKKFSGRVEELKKLMTKGQELAAKIQSGKLKDSALTEAKRELAQIESEFNLKNQALTEDRNKFAGEEQKKLEILIQTAIDKVAKANKIDVVYKGEAIAYTVDRLNITDKVLAEIKKAKK